MTGPIGPTGPYGGERGPQGAQGPTGPTGPSINAPGPSGPSESIAYCSGYCSRSNQFQTPTRVLWNEPLVQHNFAGFSPLYEWLVPYTGNYLCSYNIIGYSTNENGIVNVYIKDEVENIVVTNSVFTAGVPFIINNVVKIGGSVILKLKDTARYSLYVDPSMLFQLIANPPNSATISMTYLGVGDGV